MVKRLVAELKRAYKDFTLRYLLFEENEDLETERTFYSFVVQKLHGHKNNFAEARDITSDPMQANELLNGLYSGEVTPIGLHYVIEDYIGV